MGEVTLVHLMRHGEVENPTGIIYGRLPDFHLSALGREMAQVVAAALADRDISLVVASPLERAQETAAPVAAAHGLPVGVDERLLEAENLFEGRTFGRGDGALWRVRNLKLLANPFQPSWGEPFGTLAERVHGAVLTARDQARGHEAVLVSHQAPIWTVRRHLEGRRLWHDPRARECALASLTTLRYVGDELAEVSYWQPAGELAARGKGVGA